MADNCWYKGIKIDLVNDFTMGQLNYPNMVVAVNRLLTDYIETFNSKYVKQESDDAGVAFVETDCKNDWKNNVSCH